MFFACAIALCLGAMQLTGLRYDRTVSAQTTVEPELPRVILATAYPTINGAIINVQAGGNLQAAFDSSQPGDTIVLQAGAVYTGNFTLPVKTGSGWIIIRTSNLSGISPEGTRVSTNQAAAMPKILTPNAAPALATIGAAHHYRLVGLEIGISPGSAINYGIVALGNPGTQDSLAALPHDMVIDRCFIHGNSTGDVSRGVALNSASTAIIDSNISNCHGVGFDTQAIAGWNGAGPFKIVNNYLEAAGENVMFGGADPKVANLVPSDIEFRRNHCFKPLSWNPTEPGYGGIRWSVKNLFELKNAQRVLIDGNVFENCWMDAQTGFVIVFTPRNQDGTAPWSAVRDITFTNNIARHAAAGIQFLGRDNIFPSQQLQRIKVKNNLFYDIGGSQWGGNGRLFQIIDATADVRIDHNTAFHTSNIITADGAPHTGFVYTNNIAQNNEYGVIGSGHGIGNDSLSYYFPGCQFVKNVIIAGPSSIYPAGNFFPQLAEVGFVDIAAANYRLLSSSPYKNAGTDGLDIGANQDSIEAAIGGQQVPPVPTNQPPQVTINATAASGVAPLTVGFTANASDPDGSISAFDWSFGDGGTSTMPTVSHLYQTAGTYTARITVTDNLGSTATDTMVVTISNPPLPPGCEVVLYASQAPVRVGRWNVVSDATAAGGQSLSNPDAGAAKLATPSAQPFDYFEMSFYAVSGRAYRLWMRGKAQNDSPYNDSVFVQFSGSVDANGMPAFLIGTPDGTCMNLEDCSGCGLQAWGWQDNGWGVGTMGPAVYFAATGLQTLRVQVREDGLSIDQIILSPQLYLTSAPGLLKNDTAIMPQGSGLPAPNISAIVPNSGPAAGGTSVVISGQGFVSGTTVKFGGVPAASTQINSSTTITAITASHSAGTVDVVVTNPDGRIASIVGGYIYVAPPTPPPGLSTVAPNNGPVSGGTSVVINGQGFVSGATVKFGGVPATSIQFGGSTTITAVTASHSAGTVDVVVTNPDGQSASMTAGYVYIAPASPPAVTVLNPNGGESFLFNTNCNISWSASGGSPIRYDVYWSSNGGSTWTALASNLSASANSFLWRVPRQQTTSARIKVRRTDASGAVVEDISNANFSIRKR